MKTLPSTNSVPDSTGLAGGSAPGRGTVRDGRGGAGRRLGAALVFTALSATAYPFGATPGGGRAAEPTRGGPVLLRDLKTARVAGELVVSIVSDGPVAHEDFVLKNPTRLVMDLRNVENRIPFTSLPLDDAAVRQLRVRQFQGSEPKVTRVVFDLAADHSKYDVITEGESLRVVFHGSAGAPSPAAPAVRPAKAPLRPPAPTVRTASLPASAGSSSKPATERPIAAPRINDLSAREIPLTALAVERVPEARPRPATAVRVKAPAPIESAPPPQARPAPPALHNSGARFTGQPLTLDLVDVSLVDFFRLMAEEGGINIVMDPEIRGSLSIKVVKVPWDQIFDAALTNNNLDKQVDGNLVRIAKRSTLQAEATVRQSLNRANLLAADLETRIKRLNYAQAAVLLKSLVDQKTPRGTVVVDERSNSLILTDIPNSLDRMTELIEALDTPQQQVEIEARIVSATRDFARDIGVQFGFVQGNLERVTIGGPNTFGTIGGTRPSATPSTTYAGGNSVTGRGASSSTSSQPGSVSTGSGSNTNGNYNVNLPAGKAFGGLGLSIGNIFDTFLLDAAITAGETRGLAKLISQPKVTAQNNQAASVTQGIRFPVQVVANNTVTIQFQNAALTLTVTPQITLEGNIVLDLKVENNTPDFSRQVNGIPSIRTSESITRVLVSDGGTTVIGGILIENETTQDDRVPGLASLPVLGNLFKRSSITRNVQEVLFFITPRILK